MKIFILQKSITDLKNPIKKAKYYSEAATVKDFVDEDPMTADIISKAVYLSNDINIKDLTILMQIK